MKLADATIDIAADPATVFELFTTEDGLCSWMAAEASIDLRPGGSWRWVHDNGATSSGRYVTVEPPSLLEFTYGWETGPMTDVPPGSTTVRVVFDEIADGTRVTVEHTGLAPAHADRHRDGWTYFLGLLRDVVVGDRLPATRVPAEPGGE